jgi:hypothetical protein
LFSTFSVELLRQFEADNAKIIFRQRKSNFLIQFFTYGGASVGDYNFTYIVGDGEGGSCEQSGPWTSCFKKKQLVLKNYEGKKMSSV